MVCLTTTNVFAGNFSGGFSSAKKIYYNIQTNESYANLTNAKRAVRKWNGHSSNVTLSYGGTYTRTKGINVTVGKTPAPTATALGITYFTYNGKRVSESQRWDAALCIVYASDNFAKNGKRIKATISHEVGHALSLSHTTGSKDIMKQGLKSYVTLSNNDISWLKTKWGQ